MNNLNQNNTQINKKPLNKKTILIVAVIGVLLAGGAFGALATNTWDPMWNPFRPEPEEALKETTEKLSQLDNFEAQVLAEISLEGVNITVEADLIFVDNTTYIMIKTLPAASFLENFVDIDKLKNNWVKVESEESGSLEDAREKIDTINENLIIEELADEKIKGVATYHYKITDIENPELVVEVWIGKRDKNIHKAVVTQEFEVGSVVLTLTADYPDDLKAPDDFINFEDVFGGAGFNNFGQDQQFEFEHFERPSENFNNFEDFESFQEPPVGF